MARDTHCSKLRSSLLLPGSGSGTPDHLGGLYRIAENRQAAWNRQRALAIPQGKIHLYAKPPCGNARRGRPGQSSRRSRQCPGKAKLGGHSRQQSQSLKKRNSQKQTIARTFRCCLATPNQKVFQKKIVQVDIPRAIFQALHDRQVFSVQSRLRITHCGDTKYHL